MRELRAPTVVSADSEGSEPAAARGPAAVLRGSGPHRATRCGGRRGVHERVTARDEVAVMVTVIEVAPVSVTAGDVATVPVTAGDVERRAPAERPRRTMHRARGERRREARACCVRRSVRTRGRGRGEMLEAWKG